MNQNEVKKVDEQIAERIAANETLKKLLVDRLGEAEFISAAKTLLENQSLANCSQESILGCLLNAAILGLKLSPHLGECWIIPRNVRTGTDAGNRAVYSMVASFQIGYKGWQKLAFKSGVVSHFDYGAVYTMDDYQREFGTTTRLKHVPAFGDRGHFVAVWATATMTNGLVVADEVQFSEVEKHRRMSDSQTLFDESSRKRVKSETPVGVWATHYDTMAARIAISNICKRKLPKTELLYKAVEVDEGVTVVTDTDVVTQTAMQLAEASEEKADLIISENPDLQLHPDLKAEIDACKTQAEVREVYERQKGSLPEKLRSLYLDYATEAGLKLSPKK